MTVITPYESSVRPARTPGFGSLLRAEWTKLRTVRGFVIGLLLAAALPVAFTQLGHATCSISVAGNGARTVRNVACPSAPTGPDGTAVTDAFYFAHEALPANGSITARVMGIAGEYPESAPNAPGPQTMLSATQPWAKAGIMIKASTAPGSAYAAMLVTGSNGVRMQWDYTGDTAGLPGHASASSPRWLRLVRSGSVVSGYDSLNGTTWTLVGRYDVHGLPETRAVQVGLFAASPSEQSDAKAFCHAGVGCYDGATLATGTFGNVSAPGASGGWTGTTIGSSNGPVVPGMPSGPSVFNGSYQQPGPASFTVTGSGEIGPDVPGGPDGLGGSVQFALLPGVFAALIALIIVAALFIAAEYRRGMIRVTFAAAPSRWQLLAAKSVVIFLVTFAVSLIAVGITLPLGLHIIRGGGTPVDPISALTQVRIIVGSALLLAVSAVLALAIATMARRSVLAIVAVLVVIFIPFLLGTGSRLLSTSGQEALLRVLPVAGYSAQQAYPAYHQVIAPYTPTNGYYPLSPLAGLGVLVLWTAAALLAAGWLLRRRDA
jgi:ABC-type transport system involved in multi-copper enzyme maturation permease subunit